MGTYENMAPSEVRELIRKQVITSPTAGMSKGYTQANLAILKKSMRLTSCCSVSGIQSPALYWT